MNIDEIFAEIDRLYTANEGEKVEEYILDKLGEAAKLGDENTMIQLLNELIGILLLFWVWTSCQQRIN